MTPNEAILSLARHWLDRPEGLIHEPLEPLKAEYEALQPTGAEYFSVTATVPQVKHAEELKPIVITVSLYLEGFTPPIQRTICVESVFCLNGKYTFSSSQFWQDFAHQASRLRAAASKVQ